MSHGGAPKLYIVAGPNGAGKSTLTAALRNHIAIPIIDPDAIARDLQDSGENGGAVTAGREAIGRRSALLGRGDSFLVETTLSGTATLRFIRDAVEAGYDLHVYYVCVEAVETLIERIRGRAALGGHTVPDADVRRRYARSLRNLRTVAEWAAETLLFDNTGEGSPQHVMTLAQGQVVMRAALLPHWARVLLAPL
jgi:predicted ABC-type ATPase